MKNAIYLNNSLQAFLVKQAIAHEIKAYKDKGFKDTDFEVQQLKSALPHIKETNALPVRKEANNAN